MAGKNLQVRAADTGSFDLDYDLAGTGGWLWYIADLGLAGAGDDEGAHVSCAGVGAGAGGGAATWKLDWLLALEPGARAVLGLD